MKIMSTMALAVAVLLATSPIQAKWLLVKKDSTLKEGRGANYSDDGDCKVGDVFEVPETFEWKEGLEWYPTKAQLKRKTAIEAQEPKKVTKQVLGYYSTLQQQQARDGQEILFFEDLSRRSVVGKRGKLIRELENQREVFGTVYRQDIFETTVDTDLYIDFSGWVHKDSVIAFEDEGRLKDYLLKQEATKRAHAVREWHAKIDKLPDPENLKSLVKERKICIGMSTEAVLLSWGRPNDKNSSMYSWGKHEQWIYRHGDYKADYLYFENGILKSFQLEGR